MEILSFLTMIMTMSSVAVSMAVSVVMPVAVIVAMLKSKDADKIDSQAECTDDEELGGTTEIRTTKYTLNRFIHDFNAD